MENAIVGQLKKVSLFRDVPDGELQALALKVTEREYRPGDALIRKGETGHSLFVIVAGDVKIVSEDGQGGELVLNHCGPGETIGEMSLLDRAPRSATAIAVSPTRAFELTQEVFLETLHQRPELSFLVIQSISSRLRFATTYIEKAIEWSKRIAQGDYSTAMREIQVQQPADPNDREKTNATKADQLLSAFFQMVQNVKAREDELRQEVRKLTLEIDEARRRQQVQEVTGTNFFTDLKSEAARLRRERLDNGTDE